MTAASRLVFLASELFWFVLMMMAIPVGVLVIVLPLAFVAKLLLSLAGVQ